MCGIVGLYLKNPSLRSQLGALFSPMLVAMSERGPDSAGVAVYRSNDNQPIKVTVFSDDEDEDWARLQTNLSEARFESPKVMPIASHAVVSVSDPAERVRDWLADQQPHLRIMSSGQNLEIYKEVGLPADVLARFEVPTMSGSHMIGHTRMATESAVTTSGAHPFNTGDDLCLVHNGSLSNHNRLRAWLRDKAGVHFQTENDSEVAAGYLTWKLAEGLSIAQALEAALTDLDGFYTFAVGTRDGFSVLRDPIACKPAVMAETDDWVAMASEFRALSDLPHVNHAKVWEPEPATVYSWGGQA